MLQLSLLLLLFSFGLPSSGGSSCNEELTGYQHAGYRGCQTVTRSNKTCQSWDSQMPHEHIQTPENYQNSGLDSNYCRNPDGEPTIWCFTTDSESRWEFCDPISQECEECNECEENDGESLIIDQLTAEISNLNEKLKNVSGCYRHVLTDDYYTWDDANDYCQTNGGDLAFHWFDSMSYRSKVLCDTLKICHEYGELVWWGLSRHEVGGWTYADGTPVPVRRRPRSFGRPLAAYDHYDDHEDDIHWYNTRAASRSGRSCSRIFPGTDYSELYLKADSISCDEAHRAICEYRC